MKKIEIKNKERFALFSVIIAGIFLRLFMLGSGGISPEEYVTAKTVTGGNLLYVFFNAMANTGHPPLFYMIEHIFVSVFGNSETALRIFPALIGIFNIFLVYKLTRSFFGQDVSVLVTGVFSLNPLQVYYSQEAAVYVMFEMAALFIIYYFLISIKYNSFTAVPFIFWSVFGLYTHDAAALLLLILNLLIFIRYKEEIRLANWVTAQAVIAAAWIPVFPSFMKNLMRMGSDISIDWTAGFYSLKNFIFGPFIPFNGWIIAAFSAVLFFILIAAATRRKVQEKKVIDILVVTGFTALLSVFAASLIAGTSYSDRSIIYAGYIAVLLLCMGMSYLYREAMVAFIAVLLLIYAASYKNYYSDGPYSEMNYKKVFAKVKQDRREGDIILHAYPGSYAAFKYYSSIKEKTGFQNRVVGDIPEWTEGYINTSIRNAWRKIKHVLSKKFKTNIYAGYDKNTIPEKEAASMLKGEDRIWLIVPTQGGLKKTLIAEPADAKNYSVKMISPAKTDWIKKYFIVEEEKNFEGADLYLLRKK